MKQKVVIKISVINDKSRRKALKVAVSASGVISAKLDDKDQSLMEVIGNDLDAVKLTNKLRKKFERSYFCIPNGSGYAELVSVSVGEEEKKEENLPTAPIWVASPPPPFFVPAEHHYPSLFSIM